MSSKAGTIQASGKIKVIVGFKNTLPNMPGFRHEAALATNANKQAQRDAISQMRDLLTSSLPVQAASTLKRFKTISYVAAEIDATSLVSLANMSEVTHLQEDKLYRPVLADSIPLIGADTAWAASYSGSGQDIAILGTGVDRLHNFLSGKVISEACYPTTSAFNNSTTLSGEFFLEYAAGIPAVAVFNNKIYPLTKDLFQPQADELGTVRR